jgi:hypothetical protein
MTDNRLFATPVVELLPLVQDLRQNVEDPLVLVDGGQDGDNYGLLALLLPTQ